MPELPEVETTKNSLDPLLYKTVSDVQVFQPKLRWPIPDDIGKLKDHTLLQVKRRAKYLILEFVRDPESVNSNAFSDTLSLIVHLGMSGSLQQFPEGTPKRKHDHLIIHFCAQSLDASDEHQYIQLHYHDPRRFGAILWFDDYADKLFNHLGAEPLEAEFTGDYLYNRIHRIEDNTNRKTSAKPALKPITRPIKAVIMDQVFVVGVGNIYATESLFLSGIHPSTPAHLLTQQQLATLSEHIRAILKSSIEKGGSTLKDFTVASGTTGYFQQTLDVYGKYKQPCPHCDTPIDKVTITGRASTFCPQCQPL